jgi:nitroreductase
VDATEAVKTKLDVRDFRQGSVPTSVKWAVLEAGRLTQSGVNSQHWRFILVQEPGSMKRLAADSTSGQWVSKASFAVIICTDPKKGYHLIDAGRAAQDMQLTAWDQGVASGLFTGIRQAELRRDFGIPEALSATVVVVFGYPARPIVGRKRRKPLAEVAYLERFGNGLGALGADSDASRG